LLVVAAIVVPRGNSRALRAAGVTALIGSALFTIPPIFALKRHGQGEEAGSYMATSRVVDRGPYALVRHPQYLGYMLLAWGFALLTQHWAVIVLAAVGTLSFYLQALAEERACLAQFGASYAQYRERVPRFNVVLGVVRWLGRRL
jgi:protein-S-isoprenylcysteine O-methyltransferase Ste14